MRSSIGMVLACAASCALTSTPVWSQEAASGAATGTASSATSARMTAAEYARAEQFLGYNTSPLVLHADVRPTWGGNDRVWYRTRTAPRTGIRIRRSGQTPSPPGIRSGPARRGSRRRLRWDGQCVRSAVQHIGMSANGDTIAFAIHAAHWRCDLRAYHCAASPDNGPPTTGSTTPRRYRQNHGHRTASGRFSFVPSTSGSGIWRRDRNAS